jgi:hypothetical protein
MQRDDAGSHYMRQTRRKAMKAWALRGALLVGVAAATAACVPDWATQNSSPYILEIAAITKADGSLPILSDVSIPVVNDDALVLVNAFRKNNNPSLSTTPVEHIYLERYEVRYFRTDGRNQEGVDVPFRITGPLGNIRFHTPGPGGAGEVEAEALITIVRHQAKLEPPLRNMEGGVFGDTGAAQFNGAAVITMVAEITIHGRTVQGDALVAVGRQQVPFADFPDQAAPTEPGGGGGS